MISTTCKRGAFLQAAKDGEFCIVRSAGWERKFLLLGLPAEAGREWRDGVKELHLNLCSGGETRRWRIRRIECHPWGWFLILGEEVAVPRMDSLFPAKEPAERRARRRA